MEQNEKAVLDGTAGSMWAEKKRKNLRMILKSPV